ncbi:MAG: hypothetical protein JSW33_11845 [bacterium]|nr:MAG: hypothetical protein JSW33_11845 [bacterium]
MNNFLKMTNPLHRLFSTYLAVATFLLFFALSGCGIKDQLKKTPDFSPANLPEAHYIYEDNLLTLAARIRKADIAGGYEYEFLISNKGITPIPLDYYGDILTISYMGKIFSSRKLLKFNEYPRSLESGQYLVIPCHIDGIFSQSVYDIEKLIFKLGERRYTLSRNPGALWKDKDTVL